MLSLGINAIEKIAKQTPHLHVSVASGALVIEHNTNLRPDVQMTRAPMHPKSAKYSNRPMEQTSECNSVSRSEDLLESWDIPGSWQWVEIGQVAVVVGGGTPKTSDPGNFEGGAIPWITPADLSGYSDKYIARGFRNITEQGLKSSSARLLPTNTILFSSRAPIGYVSIASQPVTTNQGFKSFVLPESIDPSFVYYYLKCARETVESLGGGTTFKEISGAAAAKIPLAIAPLAEQRRIVAEIETQFTRLDASVAALRRAQANLKRYRASVLKDACEGRLVPAEAELAPSEGREYEPAAILLERILVERRARWESQEKRRGKYKEPSAPDTSALPELPEGWVWATVEQLGSLDRNAITDGPFGSNLKTSHYTTEGPRVIRLQNVGDGEFVDAYAHISAEHYSKLSKHSVEPGDLVIAALGETLPRACLIPSTVGPAIVKADCIKFKPAASIVVGEFLNCALNFEETRKRTAGIVHGVGRPRLNLQEIKSIPLPVPPLAEQGRIVAEVERRLSVIQQAEATVKASLARAERLRQSILKQAFSGRLVPQDPDDEPASALLERIRAEREAEAEASRAAKGKSRTCRARKATA